MIYYLAKIGITTGLIIVVSEISKRNNLIGAFLASLPLVSIFALLWLYKETNDIEAVSRLATSIFWMVLPSLALFLTLPVLLKTGLNFYASIVISMVITAGCYWILLATLKLTGIRL